MKLTVYGASDDLLEVMSDDGSIRDEFDVPGDAEFLIEDPTGYSLILRAEFGARGKLVADWTLSIRNTDNWPTHWTITYGDRPDRDEDPALILTVPDGTTVRELDS